MCGIVAVAGGGPVEPRRLAAAIRALAHRGPDGSGHWLGDNVALGHTRLAVVDPSPAGAQPIASEDGSIVAVVNGEIYDADDHARSLVARGHQLRSRCDAELLVHLYEEHGADVVTHVRGELAFVLWDARRRRLLAGRDRFGIKPLVWAAHGGGIALASEAKALFALGVGAALDEDVVARAACTQYPPPDRTLFANVHALPPASRLTWTAMQGVRVERYWDPLVPRTSEIARPADVRDALAEAVRVRLRADAPICVQLSGGLDSTAVAALAGAGVEAAFTVAFAGGGDYDERAIAARTAAELALPLHVVEVDAAAIARHWCEAVAHGEGLAINGHVVGKFLLSRAMREAGFKVALTGEGADELFAGYPHLRHDAGASVHGHAASRGVMLPTGEGDELASVRARLGFVPTWMRAKAELGARARQLLARAPTVDPYAALVDSMGGAARFRGVEPLRTAAVTWTETALAGYILRTLGDGMEMRHGIEGRVPFLDHRLAELVLALPADVLVGGDLDKPVLRRALGDIVPAHVRTRAKHPFLAPPLSRIAPALVQDLLRTFARTSSLLDGAALLAVLDRLPAMDAREQQTWDPALMLVLSAAVLDARYCR